MPGEGSRSSPILISDDEDEDIQHPRHTHMASTSFFIPNQQAFRQGLPGLPPRPVVAAQSVSNITQRVQNSGNANVNDVPRKPKRKREQSNQSIDNSASPSSALPASTSGKNLAQNGVKNKKAKHSHRGRAAVRRRMAEESEFPTPVQSSPAPPTFEPEYSLSYPYHFDPYYQNEPDIAYGSSLPENDRHSQSPHPDEDDMYEARLSSSDWVNSMARAADPLAPELELSSWDHDLSIPSPAPNRVHDSYGPSQTFTFPLSSLPPPPLPPGFLTLSVPPPPPVPSPPPSMLPILPPAVSSNANAENIPTVAAAPTVLRKIIGMPVDRDPDGKRSGFKSSSNTIIQSQPHVIYPHTPIRSNTVIMEQLPKRNRDPGFIMSWGEKAAGCAPIFLAVDPSSAKALVEFASHALARKAWASPKLGNHLSRLPSTDLKGKPREDLIRVWWYKPSKPDLVFTRSELEEGEIEDETPAESLTKETKKERKARLAKSAREERERRREAAAALLEQEKIAGRRNDTAELPVPPSFPILSAPLQLLPPLSYPLPYELASWSCPNVQYHPHADSNAPQQPGSNSQPSSQKKVVIDENRNIPTAHEEKDDEVMSIEEGDFPNSTEGTGEETATSDDLEQKPLLPSWIGSVTGDANLALSSRTSVSSALDTQTGFSPTDFPPATLPSLSSVAAPSEPRAMKNAPKAPTFTKRVLLARQKDLEARIARSKLELLQRTEATSEVKVISPAPGDIQETHDRPTSPKSPIEEKVNLPSIPVPANKDTVGAVSPKLVRENHLRNLVLASRRQKVTAVNGCNDTPVKVVTASKPIKADVDSSVKAVVQSVAAPSASNPSSSAPVPRSPLVQTSLDDLATSFIAETIQTLKPVSGHSQTPLVASQAANFKPPTSAAFLAARQKQLEEQIAESKKLMEKLMHATTKQEKDRIMASIRELSGCVAELLISVSGCRVVRGAGGS
ncbi:hypothetical protein E1B28_005774 [Marasmius oreades]|uniref:Uncharacterized protein n=1 Tax=Marasmius oreades TaxID=181124 RepID=A0A9P7S464_9AGAR|nr:uncharacterized protein E1B28_005774 [Marasmius oreades]KAG7094977.1 hypothetical protein E1B28_005774 [Marasmius oreades]